MGSTVVPEENWTSARSEARPGPPRSPALARQLGERAAAERRPRHGDRLAQDALAPADRRAPAGRRVPSSIRAVRAEVLVRGGRAAPAGRAGPARRRRAGRRRRRRRTRARWGRPAPRGLPRSIPRARRPPQTARARSRISAQPSQVARSARSTKRRPPSGGGPGPLQVVEERLSAPSFLRTIVDQVAHRLDRQLVRLVEEDAEAVLDLGGQGQQADRVEPQVLDQPHLGE